MYNSVKTECWISGCHEPTTHVLEYRVVKYASSDDYMEPYEHHVGYCYYDAKGIALSLVTTYDHEYEVLNIRPVEEEDFFDDGEDIYNGL